jgi:hypothetical protein
VFRGGKEPLDIAQVPYQTVQVLTERHVMGNMEKSLVDRCLKRAIDWNGTPYTEHRLVEQCTLDISYNGPEARSSVRMKGVRGYGVKKTRRLLPSGPLGEIQYTSPGLLHVDFPSVPLLAALRGHSAAHNALAGYYTDSSGARHPQQMTVELGAQFSQEHIDLEIDLDVVEALILNNPQAPFGNSRLVIFEMLEVAQVARKRRWKTVDVAKWRSAGLTWPLVRMELARPAAPPRPMGTTYRMSERHTKLLRLFDLADETGRARIEQAALAVGPTPSMCAPMDSTPS